eukprot:scaffold268237_cov28-Tisochrysis_lutea.AAC.1
MGVAETSRDARTKAARAGQPRRGHWGSLRAEHGAHRTLGVGRRLGHGGGRRLGHQRVGAGTSTQHAGETRGGRPECDDASGGSR